MTKKTMTNLVEGIVAQIIKASGDLFDESGARALLGAQIKANAANLVTAALPNSQCEDQAPPALLTTGHFVEPIVAVGITKPVVAGPFAGLSGWSKISCARSTPRPVIKKAPSVSVRMKT